MRDLAHRAWERWKKIAHAIGVFQTRLILTIFYYTLLFPFGFVIRLFADPLTLKFHGRNSNWIERTTRDKTLENLEKQ